MTAALARVEKFVVGAFTAEVSVPPLEAGVVKCAVVEWDPRVPRFDVDFTPAQRAEYHRKLINAVSELSCVGEGFS